MKENITNNLDKKSLIKIEKRKRHQIYSTMDYMFKTNTIMDFYSKDLIKILTHAQIWSEIRKNAKGYKNHRFLVPEIMPEDIFYAFIMTEGNIKNLLTKYNVCNRAIKRYLNTFPEYEKTYRASILQELTTKVFSINCDSNHKLAECQGEPAFSLETLKIFEDCLIAASEKFGTPIVTPEILFITLMESKKSRVSRLIKEFIFSDSDWYMLRYKLLKNIHFEESHFLNDLENSQKHFGYFLKTQLSNLEFFRLIDLDLLGLGVEFFRTKLFRKAIKIDLLTEIKKDIFYSAIFHMRKYSDS